MGEGYSLLDGETEPMGLAGAMIGVLAQEYYLHLIEGGGIKSVENEASGRVNGFAGHFLRL